MKTPMRMKIGFLVLMLMALSVSNAIAICKGNMLNPLSDVCWECMFPARIGGMSFGGEGTAPGMTDPPTCFCVTGTGVRVGLSTAFWEHARLVETVKDAYCFPSLGTGMGSGSMNALMSGSHGTMTANETGADFASQQVHYYIFPVWVMLNLFGDMPCIEKRPFDVAYMTEVDPTWNDDALSFILNPEALLFGNPITQLSCMADSVAAVASQPLDPLFWCLGSWGSSYPLSGSTTVSNPIVYNAQLASRMVFKLGRQGLLWDTAINKCSSEGSLTPIMIKSHYKLQIARPQRGNSCIPIGQSDFLWGSGKNPALGAGSNSPDNFLWVLTRARTCCVGYTFK